MERSRILNPATVPAASVHGDHHHAVIGFKSTTRRVLGGTHSHHIYFDYYRFDEQEGEWRTCEGRCEFFDLKWDHQDHVRLKAHAKGWAMLAQMPDLLDYMREIKERFEPHQTPTVTLAEFTAKLRRLGYVEVRKHETYTVDPSRPGPF